jgi:hypothetical protein
MSIDCPEPPTNRRETFFILIKKHFKKLNLINFRIFLGMASPTECLEACET